MAGEETGKFTHDPREVASLITDLATMMQDEEKDAAERQRWLQTNVQDDTLRKALSIAHETESVDKFLTKLMEVIPPYLSLLDQNQLEQFDQEFNTAMDELESEISERQHRLDDIQANLGQGN